MQRAPSSGHHGGRAGGEAKRRDHRSGATRPPAIHPDVVVAYRFVPPRDYRLRPGSHDIEHGTSSFAHRSGAAPGFGAAAAIPDLKWAESDKNNMPSQPTFRSTCSSCARFKKGCDGGHPCKRCARIGVACVYELRKRTGPKPQAKGKAGGDSSHSHSGRGSPGAAAAIEKSTSSKGFSHSSKSAVSVSPNPMPVAKILKK